MYWYVYLALSIKWIIFLVLKMYDFCVWNVLVLVKKCGNSNLYWEYTSSYWNLQNPSALYFTLLYTILVERMMNLHWTTLTWCGKIIHNCDLTGHAIHKRGSDPGHHHQPPRCTLPDDHWPFDWVSAGKSVCQQGRDWWRHAVQWYC